VRVRWLFRQLEPTAKSIPRGVLGIDDAMAGVWCPAGGLGGEAWEPCWLSKGLSRE
jgi:hypothetical protein